MLLSSRWNQRVAARLSHRLADSADTYHRDDSYRHLHERMLIGYGEATFRAAGDAVVSLRMHRRAGLRVTAPASTVSVGDLVILGFLLGPLQILAPCRVSETWDSPNRSGFSYLTLPGHPESGYERFLVEHTADDEVFLDIQASSRPASTATRLFPAVNGFFQRRITRKYQRAVA